MTVNEAMMTYLVGQAVGTFGSTLFHSEVEAKTNSLNGAYWIVRRSQSPVTTNIGKLDRDVFMDIYYINKQQQPVHEALEALEALFNACPPDLAPNYTCTNAEVVNHFVTEDRTEDERYYGAISLRLTLLI